MRRDKVKKIRRGGGLTNEVRVLKVVGKCAQFLEETEGKVQRERPNSFRSLIWGLIRKIDEAFSS